MRAHWNLKGGNLWIPTFLPTLVQGQVCTRFVTPGSYSLMPSPTKQLLSVHSAGPCPCGARSVSQEMGMSAGKQDAEWWDTCWRFPVSSIQEEEPGILPLFSHGLWFRGEEPCPILGAVWQCEAELMQFCFVALFISM